MGLTGIDVALMGQMIASTGDKKKERQKLKHQNILILNVGQTILNLFIKIRNGCFLL